MGGKRRERIDGEGGDGGGKGGGWGVEETGDKMTGVGLGSELSCI